MSEAATGTSDRVTLFLCGDVMTGRGIDQVLPHPCDPRLFETHAKSAGEYVALAEAKNGPIPRAADYTYVWGKALSELERRRPDARITNLETAVTRSDTAAPKEINYRMSPENFPCITAAGIDCCVLANNHVLDWEAPGLLETLNALHEAKIAVAGAGRDVREAAMPAVLPVPDVGRVIVFAFGAESSGVPSEWRARRNRPGVNILPGLLPSTVDLIARQVKAVRRGGDVVVVSLHWGPNWGYQISHRQRNFAHSLIERAGVDLIFGHSAHHPKGIEVHRGKAIFYGCGDFLNDYEGIRGYEAFRDDLVLMYFATIDVQRGTLIELAMVPWQIKKFQLSRPSPADAKWLQRVLDRECRKLNTQVVSSVGGALELHWTDS